MPTPGGKLRKGDRLVHDYLPGVTWKVLERTAADPYGVWVRRLDGLPVPDLAWGRQRDDHHELLVINAHWEVFGRTAHARLWNLVPSGSGSVDSGSEREEVITMAERKSRAQRAAEQAAADQAATGQAPTAPAMPDEPVPDKVTRPCICGCGAQVERGFARGHDSRHASNLRKRYAAGQMTREQVEAAAAAVSEKFAGKMAKAMARADEETARMNAARDAAKAAEPEPANA